MTIKQINEINENTFWQIEQYRFSYGIHHNHKQKNQADSGATAGMNFKMEILFQLNGVCACALVFETVMYFKRTDLFEWQKEE